MTSTVVARPAGRELVSSTLNAEQISLVKRQLMSAKREPTDDELALFIYQCDRTGLDPFARQIYAIFRKDRDGVERMGVQVSIDGLRLIADRTGHYAPGDSYWCGSDGVWRDVWLDSQPPIAARVVVRKLIGNALVEFSVPAKMSEYRPNYDGAGLWKRMPTLMLAKCSEALALRRAFPAETSGLYTAEEMSQSDTGDEVIVEQFKQAFDATETTSTAPAEPTREDISAIARESAPPTTEPLSETTPEVNAADPITEEEIAAMKAYLERVQTPESFWRMKLMTLGLDDLSQLNKGQAHQLMGDAQARFNGGE